MYIVFHAIKCVCHCVGQNIRLTGKICEQTIHVSSKTSTEWEILIQSAFKMCARPYARAYARIGNLHFAIIVMMLNDTCYTVQLFMHASNTEVRNSIEAFALSKYARFVERMK